MQVCSILCTFKLKFDQYAPLRLQVKYKITRVNLLLRLQIFQNWVWRFSGIKSQNQVQGLTYNYYKNVIRDLVKFCQT